VIAEAGTFGGCITGLLAGADVCKILHTLSVGTLATPVADLLLDGLGDSDPLGRSEIHPNLVFGVLSG